MTRSTKEGVSATRRSPKTRPIHLGEPPSACGTASPRSAWVPKEKGEAATCRICTGTQRVQPPSTRAESLDETSRRLVAWRLRRGLTQEQAAELMKTSRPRYAALERASDERMKVADLARIIGTTPGHLVRWVLETSGGEP